MYDSFHSKLKHIPSFLIELGVKINRLCKKTRISNTTNKLFFTINNNQIAK